MQKPSNILTTSGLNKARGWEFYYGLSVTTKVGAPEQRLEQDSPINGRQIIGVQALKKTTGAKGLNGGDVVNDNVFLSSHLTLKQRNAEVFEKIPLEVIYFATQNGCFYPVNIPFVDMANSTVNCKNSAALVADEEYVLVFKYLQEVTQ